MSRIWKPKYRCNYCKSAARKYIDYRVVSNNELCVVDYSAELCDNCRHILSFLAQNTRFNIIVYGIIKDLVAKIIPIFEGILFLKIIRYEKNSFLNWLPLDIINTIINYIENMIITGIKGWLDIVYEQYLNEHYYDDYFGFEDEIDYLNYHYEKEWQQISF